MIIGCHCPQPGEQARRMNMERVNKPNRRTVRWRRGLCVVLGASALRIAWSSGGAEGRNLLRNPGLDQAVPWPEHQMQGLQDQEITVECDRFPAPWALTSHGKELTTSHSVLDVVSAGARRKAVAGKEMTGERGRPSGTAGHFIPPNGPRVTPPRRSEARPASS